MSDTGPNAAKDPARAGWFVTTHWSVVFEAGQNSAPEAAEALDKLCRAYWYPLYVFIRRYGHDEETAKDLTQGFFEQFLAGPTLNGQLQAGEFRLTPRNRGNLQNRIEVSSDLLNWRTLTNYTSTDLTLQILDKDAAGADHKFYRAVAP